MYNTEKKYKYIITYKMEFYDSFAKEIIYSNLFANPISGIPLNTCIHNEQKNNDLMFGGDGLDIEPTDELKRFAGLVVPTGLYISNNVDNNSRVFKKSESKVLPDDLFQKLFEKVTKPLKYNRRTTLKKRNK
jgi:hypothetical protein